MTGASSEPADGLTGPRKEATWNGCFRDFFRRHPKSGYSLRAPFAPAKAVARIEGPKSVRDCVLACDRGRSRGLPDDAGADGATSTATHSADADGDGAAAPAAAATRPDGAAQLLPPAQHPG